MNSNDKRKEVLVVVHDAGGAEVIGAYVKKNRKHERFVCYGGGPARKVFLRLKIPLRPIGTHAQEFSALMRRHATVTYALVAAPGWMTKTEINARAAAREAGIKTVIYTDSWVDERKRFGYPKAGWQSRLPDEFWAGDQFALARLREQFPNVPTKLVRNEYFVRERARVHDLRKKNSAGGILFLGNPTTHSKTLLAVLLAEAARRESVVKIVVRSHPSEHWRNYAWTIKKHGRYASVERSLQKDLADDLARANVVIGTETMALAIAVLCGIPSINFVPHGKRSILPFPSIKKVSTPQKAALLALNKRSTQRPTVVV